mmetsp:Transcript_9688/g.36369  ORF Transcript_9688/g.36369 Transcript_9688/m.36369 type:complete len:264 (-) Transcript_9688:180-971(-)
MPSSARANAAGATSSLRAGCPRCPRRDQHGHLVDWVELILLHFATVDDEDDVLDGDARLGDVRADDHLASAGLRHLEHLRLLLGGQRGMQRQDPQTRRLPWLRRLLWIARAGHAGMPVQRHHAVLYLGQTGHEDQDGALGFILVDVRHERRDHLVVDLVLLDEAKALKYAGIAHAGKVASQALRAAVDVYRRPLRFRVPPPSLPPRVGARGLHAKLSARIDSVASLRQNVLQEERGHGVRPSRNVDNRRAVKVLTEHLGVHGR